MRLKDKITLITGASSGIGESMAEKFAKEGAIVIAVARRAEKLEELAERCKKYGGKVIPLGGDVSQKESVEMIIQTVIDKHGRIDVLVNNAGKIDDFAGAQEITDDVWESVMQLNLYGPFAMIRAALPHMVKAGKGVIVNTASVAGIQGSRGGCAYTVSKHGVVGLTKNTAFMYAKKGIRCNAVCPGSIETHIMDGMAGDLNKEGMEIATSGGSLSPRNGKPAEIAEVAVFLASDEASFVNGAVLVADGGWTAY